MGNRSLEELARQAAAGDSEALSRLVEEVQHPVYRLALRMSEVYRSDPSFAAPREVWQRVQAACPDLLA